MVLFVLVKARGFSLGLAQEIVDPHILHLIGVLSDIEVQDLKCYGSCCHALDATALAAPDFRCGHKFDWRAKSNQRGFKKLCEN